MVRRVDGTVDDLGEVVVGVVLAERLRVRHPAGLLVAGERAGMLVFLERPAQREVVELPVVRERIGIERFKSGGRDSRASRLVAGLPVSPLRLCHA
jgi:hypothetical protein